MAKVRKRTWMTKKGEQQAWVVHYKDQQGNRRMQTFERKRDADAALVDIQGEIKQGIHTPVRASITVAEAADLWIEHCEAQKLERSTLVEYRRNAENYIKPVLGKVKLASLTMPAVTVFRDKLLRNHSRAMTRKVMTSLKSIISCAQERGLVAQNVASPVKFAVSKREKTKLEVGRDIPSKEEIQTILATATGRWRPLLVTAVFTGMRASELRGLTWDAVDFDKKVLHVRQRANLWCEIGHPKSAAARREIPLAPIVVNALREWKLACPKGAFNLVFPNGNGRVESHGNIAHRGFGAIQRKAGIVDVDGNHKYGLHALRHFFASWVIERGFSPKRAQALLGHSSIQMTFDTYAGLFPSLEDDAAKFEEGERDLLGSVKG
jgi:integrase